METETANQRLKRIRKARGYRSARLAAYAMQAAGYDVKEPTYTAHESGPKKPTRAAETYGEFFGVPPAWIIYGPGGGVADPFADGPPAQHGRDIRSKAARLAHASLAKRRPEMLEDGHDGHESEIIIEPGAPDLVYPDNFASIGSETGRRNIPAGAIAQLDASGGMGGGGLTMISDGVPGRHSMTFSAEAIADYWRLPPGIVASLANNASDIIVLPVKGVSMLPVLAEGDFVFIDIRHRRPSPDGIYALADEYDEIIVKTLRSVDGRDGEPMIEIVSANPEYPVRRKHPSELRIIGRVVRRFATLEAEWPAGVLDGISRVARAETFDRRRMRNIIVRVAEEFGNTLTPDQICETIMSTYDGHEPRFLSKKRKKPAPSGEKRKAS